MTESSPDDAGSKRKDFICGVVEGFYGRPWTTEQRKDLFQKLKKWGMDMYVYAPKDDYKHRAYWRELYTVEEAEHLTSLITAAKAQGITFCYALSPGLDITYSSQKEITILKRKLEQVSQFGCTCFALLFDDIEPEMSDADKQIFQSFAHAQVSVTNEIHQHLGCPRFLLCPTQYCSTRALPTVNSSEYLNTLGTKLSQQIDIMWTGPKVISKTLTTECIEEITQVLRRPPVIWDNLHANDYDQKRIFLGPYCGRSPELIPLLRGVLSNPNCEYNANMIAIWTLAHWASCSLDAPQHMEAVSWDIKLERESEQGVCDDEAPLSLGKHVYHHRQALKLAINEWLPEFSIPKAAQGPVIKPHVPIIVPPVPMIPILPMVNTCMLLTSTCNTATTSTAAAIPKLSTTQLQALADGCCSTPTPLLSTGVTSDFNPTMNPVMNSLVSPTQVILNESIPNPIIPIANSNVNIPQEIPVSTLPVPILGLKSIEDDKADQNMVDKQDYNESIEAEVIEGFGDEMKKVKDDNDDGIFADDEPKIEQRNGDMSVGATPQTLSPCVTCDETPASNDSDVIMNDGLSENGSMQVEPSNSPLSTDMMMESIEPIEQLDDPVPSEQDGCAEEGVDASGLTAEDLVLLCELFYLPFEHGARALRLLTDFHWLTDHAHHNKPHNVGEWRRRRSRFAWWAGRARRLARRLAAAHNHELYAELQPYVLDLCAVLAHLDGFIRWLELGKFSPKVAINTQATYTWFSKGWREAFESGLQEPWVFRGGLTADLRRLLPIECSGEVVRSPQLSATQPYVIRPCLSGDEEKVRALCIKSYNEGPNGIALFPSDLESLPADRYVLPFLTLSPELCMVLEEDGDITTMAATPHDDRIDSLNSHSINNGISAKVLGYACAALNSREFHNKMELAWIPEMKQKYPLELLNRDDLSDTAKDCIQYFHSPQACPAEGASILLGTGHHALLACLLHALRASGANSVQTSVEASDTNQQQLFRALGFLETSRSERHVCFARSF